MAFLGDCGKISDNPDRTRLGRPTQIASARCERAEQDAGVRERCRVPQEEVEGPSTSALRSRLSRASSSHKAPKEVHVHAHEEVCIPAPEVLESAPVHVTPSYPGGPSDSSLLIYYSNHVTQHVSNGEERSVLKSVNHPRKIFTLYHPVANWFRNAIIASGLSGLYYLGYNTISHEMQGAFVER
ncbi:uncharacterized protein LOC131615218 [Vicia villosa]|uniref:uncharacterized protein LOC131615218 n=1 Tax=Vicia villosa TaxID=3911 RepID=UPI00273B7F1F|nr:uncharacterized protein LOC131615218 [Vicia villosa]